MLREMLRTKYVRDLARRYRVPVDKLKNRLRLVWVNDSPARDWVGQSEAQYGRYYIRLNKAYRARAKNTIIHELVHIFKMINGSSGFCRTKRYVVDLEEIECLIQEYRYLRRCGRSRAKALQLTVEGSAWTPKDLSRFV